MSDLVTAVLTPFDYVVSAPLVAWHEIFDGVLGLGPGWAWALAIVGTAVTFRIVLLPFYLSQLRMRRDLRSSSRRSRRWSRRTATIARSSHRSR